MAKTPVNHPKNQPLWILVISLLLAIGFFTYKYLKTSTPTYFNQTYGFSLNYPANLSLTEDQQVDKPYDDLLAEMTGPDYSLKFTAITDIDIYDRAQPRDVAHREVMDSGFRYQIVQIQMNGYPVALTQIPDTKQLSLTATIAHPTRNLFIQIRCSGNCQSFIQILSTFRFTP